jgi:hypothetical protein
MAVSHSFTGEDIEDGGGKEPDADRKQNNIKHGNNPRVYPFSGVPHGGEPKSGISWCVSSALLGIKIREASASPDISEP